MQPTGTPRPPDATLSVTRAARLLGVHPNTVRAWSDQGRDSGVIRKVVRTVLEGVEAAYGSVFDTWDGDMGQVEATRDLLREGFLETDRPWSLVRPKAP